MVCDPEFQGLEDGYGSEFQGSWSVTFDTPVACSPYIAYLFGVWDLGLGVCGLWFVVCGLGFGV